MSTNNGSNVVSCLGSYVLVTFFFNLGNEQFRKWSLMISLGIELKSRCQKKKIPFNSWRTIREGLSNMNDFELQSRLTSVSSPSLFLFVVNQLWWRQLTRYVVDAVWLYWTSNAQEARRIFSRLFERASIRTDSSKRGRGRVDAKGTPWNWTTSGQA